MKSYTTKSNARRAAVTQIAKAEGLPQADIKKKIDELVTIEPHEDGGFFWRRIQTELKAPSGSVKAKQVDELADEIGANPIPEELMQELQEAVEEDDFEEDCRREMTYDEAGNPIPVDSLSIEGTVTGRVPSDQESKSNKPKEEKKSSEPKKESTASNPCKMVWEIAEKMQGAKRKDIIQACVDAGIAYNTARTQYQRYYSTVKKGGA